MALTPMPGKVRPAVPSLPSNAASRSMARIAPANWAATYGGTRCQGKSPRRAKARLTTGLRWAPEMAPKDRIMLITVKGGCDCLDERRYCRAAELGVDHADASRDEDQHEGAQQLRTESAPLPLASMQIEHQQLPLPRV